MKILGICGMGGSGKEILELVKRVNDSRWDQIIFVDKTVEVEEFRGCAVDTFEGVCEKFSKDEIEFIISVGDVYIREKIYKQITEAGYELTTLVAPGVYIPDSVKLGQGVIVRDNVFVSVDTVIEDNAFIQPNAVVGHDVTIGKHTVISSQSVLAGGVSVGSKTYVALGSLIKELTSVGDDTIVSMGTVVNKNVDSGVIVRGNPVEVVSKNFLKSAFRLNNRGKAHE